jgi:hypothetical protein
VLNTPHYTRTNNINKLLGYYFIFQNGESFVFLHFAKKIILLFKILENKVSNLLTASKKMPYISVLTASDSEPNPKSVFYEFGDEKIESIVKKAYPSISRGESDIMVGDDIINSWSMNVGTCILLGDHIIVCPKPPVNEYIFVISLNGQKIKIGVEMSMTIGQLKEAIQELEEIPFEVQRLIYAGRQLENDRILSDYNTQTGSTFHMVLRLSGGGGPPFVDLSDSKGPQKIGHSNNAPDWRTCSKGLCLEGPCSNAKCNAFKKMVIITMGSRISYQMGVSNRKTNCPMCHKHVIATTCAFNNCDYRFFGIKRLPSGETERIKSGWKEADNNYYRFDPVRNGVADWISLAIECRDPESGSVTKPCTADQIQVCKQVIAKFLVWSSLFDL